MSKQVGYLILFNRIKLLSHSTFPTIFNTKRGSVSNTQLLNHGKMLLGPMNFFSHLMSRLRSGTSGVKCFDWANLIFATYFILRGHDRHIDFLQLLWLVGIICPLMQEHFLWPLWNVKLFIAAIKITVLGCLILQRASMIWITIT